MKINTKIILSFFLTVTVPVTLALLCLFILLNLQKGILEETYNIEIDNVSEIFETTVLLDKICESAMDEVINEEAYLLDEDSLDVINANLEKRYSFLIILRDGEIYYQGDDSVTQKLIDALPSYDDLSDETALKNYYLVENGTQYLVKARRILFPAGRYGKALGGVLVIVSKTDSALKEVTVLSVECIAIFLLVMILTGVCLTLWLHRSIVKPLNYLEKSANRIATGDLDFKIVSKGDDEFGDLTKSFESMRGKLKEYVDKKVQYEVDSRELLTNISHDLKTPLTSIKGYVEGLLDGVADTQEKRDKYLQTIYNKSKDMDRLIGEVTLFSKLDTGDVPYNFEKIDIDGFLSELCTEWKFDLEEKNIFVQYENNLSGRVMIKGDVEKLIRVVNNIIGNSVKYLDKDEGHIHITLEDIGESVKITIADNGKGIEKENLELIFERFYRTDASRNSKQGGSGIGLAIVKKIIEQHDGRVWAESEVNEGTAIVFTLQKAASQPDE